MRGWEQTVDERRRWRSSGEQCMIHWVGRGRLVAAV
jgi:hypothetical protein